MKKQRECARKEQTREVIRVSDATEVEHATQFAGYDHANLSDFATSISAIVEGPDADFVIMPQTPFYAEKGGQVGDTGFIEINGTAREVFDTKMDNAGHLLHNVRKGVFKKDCIGKELSLTGDIVRRRSIERQHASSL